MHNDQSILNIFGPSLKPGQRCAVQYAQSYKSAASGQNGLQLSFNIKGVQTERNGENLTLEVQHWGRTEMVYPELALEVDDVGDRPECHFA